MARRSTRVSDAQWNILLEYLERNPSLAKSRSYNNTKQGRNDSRNLWQDLANALNAEGSGTEKTPKEWSTYVSNYKSKLKRIVADINADANATGGGPPQGSSSLSDIDNRFLAIMGPGFGQAAPQVTVEPFPGVDQSQPSTLQFAEVVQNVEILAYSDAFDESEAEIPARSEPPAAPAPVSNGPPEPPAAPAPVSNGPPDAIVPRLPRQTRRTRYRHRPLAPLEAAHRTLTQFESQRAAADLANAQALQLIGESLRRLADAAERFVARGESQ